MLLNDAKNAMNSGAYHDDLHLLYNECEASKARYVAACDEFGKLFGTDREVNFYSAPGRTEVGGNHTDHQRGCVLAGSVNLDVIAVASPNDEGIIRIKSAGYNMDTIDLGCLTPVDNEVGKAASLIRGMAAIIKEKGFKIGGFDAYTTSNVLKGSGLSSSAAFEVLVGVILSNMYNDGKIDAVEIAKMAQYAENVFFGKPCGLMDQMASSVGGFTGIDFADTANPVIEKVDFNLADAGYKLCIVNTGGNHADLTNDYADVTTEMRSVSEVFGKEVLREVDEEQFKLALPTLREKCNDRAILRAMHFFADSRCAVEEKEALKAGDIDKFLSLVKASGRSSYMRLQNVFSTSAPTEQGLPLALAITEQVLGERGAFRVHGGGFAGTIQAFVPTDLLEEYINEIEVVFGNDTCYVLNIRPVGGYALTTK